MPFLTALWLFRSFFILAIMPASLVGGAAAALGYVTLDIMPGIPPTGALLFFGATPLEVERLLFVALVFLVPVLGPAKLAGPLLNMPARPALPLPVAGVA